GPGPAAVGRTVQQVVDAPHVDTDVPHRLPGGVDGAGPGVGGEARPGVAKPLAGAESGDVVVDEVGRIGAAGHGDADRYRAIRVGERGPFIVVLAARRKVLVGDVDVILERNLRVAVDDQPGLVHILRHLEGMDVGD